MVAQNQIQSQIILLQGTVIKLLEEALLTGTIPDINRLYNTSEFAREGSIRALHDQYQRLLESRPPPTASDRSYEKDLVDTFAPGPLQGLGTKPSPSDAEGHYGRKRRSPFLPLRRGSPALR